MTGADVSVWRVALDPARHATAELERLLSESERERAAAFRFPEHRDAYVIAHGALRSILGALLGSDPAALRFEAGREGKPSLAGGDGVRFNLSHTDGVALVATTTGAEVGVDVEAIRDRVAIDAVARRAFHPDERAALRRLPEPERRRAFFRLWSRKEAVIKADGRGLSLDPSSFVLPLPGMSVRDLDAGPAHAAAVAVAGAVGAVRCEDWPHEG